MYSRSKPSARYLALLDQYKSLHLHGEPFMHLPAADTFPGRSLLKDATEIKSLIQATGSRSILDYGAGKGLQYRPKSIRFPGMEGEWGSIAEYWDVDNVTCYDPAYPPFSALPKGIFDGVICTDVLEHCSEQDLPWIADEVFGFADRFVYLSVAGFAARKRLPNGENAHCTIQGLKWWQELVTEVARSKPDVAWAIKYWDGGKSLKLIFSGKGLVREHARRIKTNPEDFPE